MKVIKEWQWQVDCLGNRMFRPSFCLFFIGWWIQLSQSLIGYDQCDQMLELKVAQFCTKFAQKESIFFIKREFFEIRKSCPIFGMILQENMSQRLFKSSSIWSHWICWRLDMEFFSKRRWTTGSAQQSNMSGIVLHNCCLFYLDLS